MKYNACKKKFNRGDKVPLTKKDFWEQFHEFREQSVGPLAGAVPTLAVLRFMCMHRWRLCGSWVMPGAAGAPMVDTRAYAMANLYRDLANPRVSDLCQVVFGNCAPTSLVNNVYCTMDFEVFKTQVAAARTRHDAGMFPDDAPAQSTVPVGNGAAVFMDNEPATRPASAIAGVLAAGDRVHSGVSNCTYS